MRINMENIKLSIDKQRAKKQAKLRNEFLPEALEIIEKPTSPAGHAVIIITAILIISFIIWAFVGKMDTVATARGSLETTGGIQDIQSEKGGIVSEICVKEGDKVSVGDPIYVLDNSVGEIAIQNIEEGLELLEYENSLLQKIINDEPFAPEENMPENKRKVMEYVTALEKGFMLKISELNSTADQVQEQVKIEEETLAALNQSREDLKEQKKTLEGLSEKAGPQKLEEEKIEAAVAQKEKEYLDYTALYNAGVISKAEYTIFENELNELKKDLEIQKTKSEYEVYDVDSKLEELNASILALEKEYNKQQSTVTQVKQRHGQETTKVSSNESDFTASISKIIMENSNKIVEQKANLDIQLIDFGRQTLTSPVDGIIKTLDVDTVGGVIAPTQVAATIVIEDTQLIAEVDILNKDIGFIKVGQSAAIKLDTYNFQKYGKLEGEVISISPDAILDERKGQIYKVKVSLDKAELKKRSPQSDISAGMECTAEIKISERRIVDFFLEPVMEHFDGSLGVK